MQVQSSTVIDLLRHGKPEGGSVYRGSSDDPLTTLGWQQMQSALQGHNPWVALISSPLKRCSDFAGQWANDNNVNVDIIDALKEIHFGDWEGKTFTDIIDENAGYFNQHMHDPLNYPPPNGESLTEFAQRICGSWHEITNRYKGQHVLMVTHGGVVRIVLHLVLNIPLHAVMRVAVPYAALTRIRINHYANGESLATMVFHDGKL